MVNYKKQALYNTVANIIYLFSQWLFTVIITKLNGYEEAGILSLAMTVGNLLFFIGMYGMRSFQVSDMTQEFIPSEYISSRYITVFISLVLCAVILPLFGYWNYKGCCIFLYLVYRSLESISDVYFGEMQRLNKLELTACSMIGKSAVSIMVFVLCVLFTNNLASGLFGICVVAFMTTFLVDRMLYRQMNDQHYREAENSYIIKLLCKCFPLMLATVLPVMVTMLPRISLEKHYGAELLGYYGNISTPTVLITALVPSVLVPIMSLYGRLIEDKSYRILKKSFLLSLVGTVGFGFICILGAYLLGKPVLCLVYTKQIEPFVTYLVPLIVSTTIYALTMCANAVLISMRKNVQVSLFISFSLVVCLGICDVLVKSLEIDGAIFVLIISYTVQLLLQMIYILRLFKNKEQSTD